MDHVAIMKPSWKFNEKILSGEKTIESRWYVHKYPPWDRVHKGEIIYFKDSGKEVTAQATIANVIQFSELTPEKVHEILQKYRRSIGIIQEDLPFFYNLFKEKRYCILIFLSNPRKVLPFHISKKGFGNMATWIAVPTIEQIKIKELSIQI